MAIIIDYENIMQLMTTLFLSKLKKVTINFWNLFDTGIGLRVLEMAYELRRSNLKIFWGGGGGGMPPDPPRGSRLRRSLAVPLKVARFQFN